jgi:hypothetical protein
MTRTEQAARHMMTMATVPFASDHYRRALADVSAMQLAERETMAAAHMAREWFDLAKRIAGAMDAQRDDCPRCPFCGWPEADRTTPCGCPPRDRGDVADALPF